MQTLNEMLTRGLLTQSQHVEISTWIVHAKTLEGIMRMPPHLWKPFELASVLMNVDADLTQPPLLSDIST
jgi:hypothetical protein